MCYASWFSGSRFVAKTGTPVNVLQYRDQSAVVGLSMCVICAARASDLGRVPWQPGSLCAIQ